MLSIRRPIVAYAVLRIDRVDLGLSHPGQQIRRALTREFADQIAEHVVAEIAFTDLAAGMRRRRLDQPAGIIVGVTCDGALVIEFDGQLPQCVVAALSQTE
jgi:hypothetical protein